MSSRNTKRILQVLEKNGIPWPGGPENAEIVRTPVSQMEGRAGHWIWHLEPIRRIKNEKFPSVGSSYPASRVRKDWEVHLRSRLAWPGHELSPPTHTRPSPTGRNLRQERTKRGWSEFDLAIRAKVPLRLLRYHESGSVPTLSTETLHRLAEALECPLETLLGEGEERTFKAGTPPGVPSPKTERPDA